MRKLFLAVGLLCLFGADAPASAADGFDQGGKSAEQTALNRDVALFQFDTNLETERTVSSDVIQINRETPSSHYVFAAVSSLLILTLGSRMSRGSETPTRA